MPFEMMKSGVYYVWVWLEPDQAARTRYRSRRSGWSSGGRARRGSCSR